MTDCLFCKVINNQVDANIIYSDDKIIAFDDINPQAPHHKIIIPKKHIPSLNDLTNGDALLMGHMVHSAAQLAKQLNIAEKGYRLVMNCNERGGQTVFHVHLHLIGGRQMIWPPG